MNEHLEADGPDVFHHACMMGLEGIVSKRKDCGTFRPLAALDQEQEPERAGGETGSRRGLGSVVGQKRETFEPVTLGHIRSIVIKVLDHLAKGPLTHKGVHGR